ncbi:MAG: phenylalanine--tRNA ligase subunit beta [Kiritimatiellae bacterium]|nr:phenylalanine--tRNA ligase subunit beta [Kiritimatiellia bacterium]MDW8458049.1 phenylalanine--tRNA ligase subunit beta [Verrucomicrobiota bacterium]
MKVPLSWLRDYIEFEESARELAERLTFSGTEVEAIETIGTSFEGLVVAEVIAVEKHPNADKLTVCRVFDGASVLQVVCGAPNVKTGGRYPFAPVGVTLPGGSQTIRKAVIRGVESQGMLCAPDEIGISDDHSGLLELPPEHAAGTPLRDVFGPPETVLDLEITPNRPDCLSLIGIARELAAVLGRPLKLPLPIAPPSQRSVRDAAIVTVEDADGCARYTARVLESVKIGPSPLWMKRRLEAAGIRSINNVVDITNYVMLETGHPLHAFDRDLLHEGRIVVRRARDGERIRTLDDIERELDPSMLVIADGRAPVALAGIMGGAGSEIRPTTRTVLLEAAWFDPALIRSTSRKLGLSTESSYRFERGVDLRTVEWASRRAAQLMAELAGARETGPLIDTCPEPPAPREIRFRTQTIRDALGLELRDEEIVSILNRLEIRTFETSPGEYRAVAPSFRGDLEREVDFVEEVARIHGLDHVPAPHPRAVLDPHAGRDDRFRTKSILRSILCGLGASEIMNYSLVSEALLDALDPGNRTNRVPIPRPISADQSVLRTSLIPQMVETLGRNRSRQIEGATLFEIGRIFRRTENGVALEEERLCLGLMGPVGRGALDRRRPVEDEEMFLWGKGLCEALCQALNQGEVEVAATQAAWSDGPAVEIRAGGQTLGILGLIARRIRREWRLNDPIAVAEFNLDALLSRMALQKTYREFSAFPSIARDVAMIVDHTVTHADIIREIRAAAPPELERIELFDVFTGPAIGEGRRSVAYSLIYRSDRRTLTDDEANAYHLKVKAALRERLKAEIRE